jgi:Family of unknown function (DUF6491)
MNKNGLYLSLALVLAGCASTGPSLTTDQRLQLYRENSTPVGSFRVDSRNGRVTHWTALGDQALTVWGTTSQVYLLELRSRCSGLSFATHITISNSFGTVTPGFDSVQPLSAGRAATSSSCRIASARRINNRSLQEAKQDMREASLVERDPNAKPDDNAN